MTQGPLSTPTGSGLAVRSGLNDAIERVATNAAGTSRPSDIATWEMWLETDNPGTGVGTLWMWDGASDIFIGLVDSVTHAFTSASVLTTQGDMLYRGASADTRLAAGADAFKSLFTGGAGANPAWAGSWKVLGEITAAGAGSMDVTGIPSTVHHLMLIFRAIPSTNNVAINLRTAGADGNFDTGGTDYNTAQVAMGNAGSPVAQGGGAGLSSIPVSYLAAGVANDGSEGGVSGFVTFSDIQAAAYTRCQMQTGHAVQDLSNRASLVGDGVRLEADRITGVRLFASSGNISGRALVLGARN